MSYPFGDLGPATVIWDVGGTPVDLGPVLGSVQFTDEPKFKEIREEGYGETMCDAAFVGRICQLIVPMTRSQLAQLEKVIPSSTLVSTVLTVKASVGTQMLANAKKVTIKRLVDGVASVLPAEWLTIYKAHAVTKSDWKFDAANQRVQEVTFLVFPRTDSGHVGEMWAIGE